MSENKRYWHELSTEEHSRVLATMTLGEIEDKFLPPRWCWYGPYALAPNWGCWSLTGAERTLVSEDYCKECRYCQNPADAGNE